ncbi:ROK family glucokinase [Acidaminobacter sp. JC074]|uniref:ROK family protein n=1 Tax=Acidaminobacter sp. JC074 TaxID=2530199 RepID=UPI001F0D1194|nr:ROK family glucokinase [Acidaminobacter sp. JC074]MCH4887770.1 ROK family glucokinase [Acidaminobacter sp. JC074]
MLIGIDLGGTNIAAGLVNDEGELIFKKSIPTMADRPAEELIKDIYMLIDELRNSTDQEVEAVGIGIPGLVNKDMSVVLTCANLHWNHVRLMDGLKNLGLPIAIDNDANVAAYAEYKIGSLKGVANGIMVTLGTGVGGGIIIDDREVRGGHGIGTELGHMIIGDNFYDCNCGSNGCFETFASATAIIKYAEHLVETTELPSKLRELDKITAKDVIDLSKEEDVIACETYERFIKYLARGIVNVLVLLDPERIALGGGVSGAGDYLLERLKKEVDKQYFLSEFSDVELVISELGNDAGIIGAALVAKDHYN